MSVCVSDEGEEKEEREKKNKKNLFLIFLTTKEKEKFTRECDKKLIVKIYF